MVILLFIFELILFVWFLGCTITYKFGKHTLVEGMGTRSAEFAMLLIYATCLLFTMLYPNIGQWGVLLILLFWIIIQFFCHWYYTIFGASDVKIKGYNECFRDTVRIFPQSDKKLIPDFYHIVLHILILINITLSIVYLLFIR